MFVYRDKEPVLGRIWQRLTPLKKQVYRNSTTSTVFLRQGIKFNMAAHKYHSVVQKLISEYKNPVGKTNPAANKMRTNHSCRSTP